MSECTYYEFNEFFCCFPSEHFASIDKEIRFKPLNNSFSVIPSMADMQDEEHASDRASISESVAGEERGPSPEHSCSYLSEGGSADDVSVLDEGAVSDKDNTMNLIHEWLFSEDVPHFNKSDVLKNLITNDDDFKILFKLMMTPFSFKLHTKAVAKYRRMNNNLKIELKSSLPRNETFTYRPDKHNPFYLRARRVMIIFFFKPNLTTIIQYNKNFVDIFYEILFHEVLENGHCKSNMDWVFKIMQYFLIYDIDKSIKNILKYNLIFYLVANIEVVSARMTLECLLIPGDRYFRIPEIYLQKIYGYLNYTNFFGFMVECAFAYDQKKIRIKIETLNEDPKLHDTKLTYIGDVIMGGVKNVFVNIFHSFFNIKLLMKNHKQPEDYNMANFDVDRVALQDKKDRTKRMSRQFLGSVLTGDVRNELPPRSDLIQSGSFDSDRLHPQAGKNVNTSVGSRDALDGTSPTDRKTSGRKSILRKVESQIGFIDPTQGLFTNAKGLVLNVSGVGGGMMDNDDYFMDS
jgi:hypothetical protein